MKRLIFILAMMLTVQSVSAQFSFGLRGGMNFTSLPSRSFNMGEEARIETLPESYTGFHIGLIGQLRLGGLFIQPELLYVATGNQFKYDGQDAEQEIFFTQRFSKIDMPVLIGLKSGPLRLGIGPVASLMLDNSSNLSESQYYRGSDSFREDYNDLLWGYQLGFGLDLGNIALDLKYQGSFNNVTESMNVGGTPYNFDNRPRQIILSIGLFFF